MKKTLGVVAAALVGVGLVWWLASGTDDGGVVRREPGASAAVRPSAGASARQTEANSETRADEASAAAEDADDATVAEPMSEEDKAAAAEEKLVNDFDALTDKWMEPAKGGVSMADVDRFVRQFKALPDGRKDECLHRALNLVPDENVLLLAGILLDKSIGQDYLELVFNDVLNRDEDVKKPILGMVFKDKTHPCWADTAWILDVTGELPTKK